MARDFAQLHLKIWNDDDFRALTTYAQHLYFVLISQPGLERTGVNDWKPGRIAQFARGWSISDVNRAASELISKLFILVDFDTDEYLIRSYVRNDQFMKQENLATNMARSFAMVSSNGIRGVIIHELKRLREDRPDLNGWRSAEVGALLGREGVDPRVFPCGKPEIDPTIDPGIDPQVDPAIHPGVDPRIDPRVDPGVEGERRPTIDPGIDPSTPTATSTTTFQQEQERASDFGLAPSVGSEIPSSFFQSDFDDEGVPSDWSQASDPRCRKHAQTPVGEVPPCRACGQAREWFQEQAEQERAEARRIIDECGFCDDRGIATTKDTLGESVAVRCDHIEPPRIIERPTSEPSRASVPNWRQAIKRAKTGHQETNNA